MLERDEFLAEIKDRLEQAQQQAKSQYDKTHRHVEFQVGDWVLWRLLHRPTASLNDTRGRGKLGQRYFGPYRVLERIGSVAYRLQLPVGARLHGVFHVGLLKPFIGEPPEQVKPLPPIHHGRACSEPEKVLRGRLARGTYELLVQWKGADATAASLVPLFEFRSLYPTFQLVLELELLQQERDVMHGKVYMRRKKKAQAPSAVPDGEQLANKSG